jgi:hypothetical protein
MQKKYFEIVCSTKRIPIFISALLNKNLRNNMNRNTRYYRGLDHECPGSWSGYVLLPEGKPALFLKSSLSGFMLQRKY